MRIAYVGDFINHGGLLYTSGTSVVILTSLLEDVTSIDVFCPRLNKKLEEFELPTKVRLFEFYKFDHPLSILKLLRVTWKSYDTVIFNMLSTGFGNTSTANGVGLIVPILLTKLFRQSNIRVIYHNSVFTNDVRTLGYNSAIDKIRAFFLGIVERTLFKSVSTFVLLDLYKQRIDETIGKNMVQVLKSRYLEAITTLYMNKTMFVESFDIRKTDIPIIRLHGSWGPQKNIELALSALRNVKESEIKFKLIISGGINHHFSLYERNFNKILNSYSDIIDEYLGPVSEKKIMQMFLDTDLLILPYNTPGGHSGVLEQAIFFEIPTIAVDFPEYREQVNGITNIILVKSGNLYDSIRKILTQESNVKRISIQKKILQTIEQTKLILV